MRKGLQRTRRRGILTFEWIFLVVLLVIGIAGGVTLVRDGYIIKAAQTGEAILRINNSYEVSEPLACTQTFNYYETVAEFGNIGVLMHEDCASEGAAGSKYVDSISTVQKPLVTVSQQP